MNRLPPASTGLGDGAETQPPDAPGGSEGPAFVARFDRWAEAPFVRLRGHRWSDRLFYGLSETANFSLLWHAMAWVPVLVLPTPARAARAAGTSVALAVESAVVNGPVKSAFRRERPAVLDPATRPHRLRQPKTTSFPSGHASAAMVAALMLGRNRNPWTRGLLVGLGILVATSRIYVRIHHASDVVAGLVLGAGLGRVLRRVLP